MCHILQESYPTHSSSYHFVTICHILQESYPTQSRSYPFITICHILQESDSMLFILV